MAANAMLMHGPCPFVDQGDGRCSCRMTKQTLDQAFTYCLGGRHFTCLTYHALSWQCQADSDESETELQPGPTTPITGPTTRRHPAAATRIRTAGQGGHQAVA